MHSEARQAQAEAEEARAEAASVLARAEARDRRSREAGEAAEAASKAAAAQQAQLQAALAVGVWLSASVCDGRSVWIRKLAVKAAKLVLGRCCCWLMQRPATSAVEKQRRWGRHQQGCANATGAAAGRPGGERWVECTCVLR
eukprot:scaffold45324_cov20-Tisochrysis_lutea.AAC.4